MRAMKDSGIEWIGQIPQTWDTKKLKFLVGLRTEKTADKTVLSPYVGLEHVVSSTGTLIEDYEAILDFAGDTLDYKKGDVLFGKLRPYLAKAIQAETDGRCSSEFWVMDPHSINGRFLLYAVLSHGFISCIDQSTFGVKMPRAEWEYAGNQELALPDSDTQCRIAYYLDAKCADINALIAAKEKTNALLKERRQSIIYEAVTKGLNPDAPMKDSGIEWIGQIPEHWTVKKIKYLGTFRNGLTYSPDNVTNEESGTLVLRSSNIQNGNVVFDDNVYVDMDIPEILQVAAGDILICSRNGSRELIGKNAIIPENVKASFGAFMMIFRCGDPKYLYYILNSNVFSYYLGTFLTSTVNQLTAANFGNMKVVYCDSAEEREEIVAHLDQKCEELDAAISTNEATIQKLKEYRQSIIYEAVTGKIEV